MKLRRKINCVLLPYFIIFLIPVIFKNVSWIQNSKLPDILYCSKLTDFFVILFALAILFLLLLNLMLPIWRGIYKMRFPFKKTIEKILNMDKGKKKIINITCWVLMAVDVIVMVLFKIMSKGEGVEIPRDLGVFHGFFIPFWFYQIMFNFFFPLIRGDYDKYLY